MLVYFISSLLAKRRNTQIASFELNAVLLLFSFNVVDLRLIHTDVW